MENIIVTAATHPALFEVLEEILHDSGVGTGRTNAIPIKYALVCGIAEMCLSQLTEEERTTFAIGDEEEQEAIAARGPEFQQTREFLNQFFDDFVENQ